MLKKKRLSNFKFTGDMTLPDERYRAVLAAERLLKDLCDPSVTPRVPKAVRARASSVLRHYPGKWDMDRAATAASHVFETRDPVDDLVEFIYRGTGTK